MPETTGRGLEGVAGGKDCPIDAGATSAPHGSGQTVRNQGPCKPRHDGGSAAPGPNDRSVPTGSKRLSRLVTI
jgi:hypothetical protein